MLFTAAMIVSIAMFAVALIATLVLMLKRKEDTTRAVVSDFVFYCMVAIYMIWTIMSDTRIVYEIAVLAAFFGLLTTVSNARVLTKGRR